MNKQEDRILTYFTQNEDELREKKRLAISEFAKTEKDRGILIVACPGHMQDALLATLTMHHFDNLKDKIIVIGEQGQGKSIGDMGPLYIEEQLHNLKETKILIQSYREDLVEIFLEKEKKPYRHFDKQYIPKTQKRKGFTTKGYRTRNK